METRVGIGILCGGKGRRMGGIDKGMLRLDGDTFLSRLVRLSGCFDERLISGDPERISAPEGFRVWPDDVPDCGPMGGICTLLRHCRSSALLIVACDMPLFGAEAIGALLDAYSPAVSILALETAPGSPEPLAAIYNRSCLPALERALADGRLRMRAFLRENGAKSVPFADRAATWNVNTPDDYAALTNRKG